MSEKIRESIARELFTVLLMRGTPDIIALDCQLKKKYSSPARPWPFENVEEAAKCFRKVADSARKYDGIAVSTDKNILRLSKIA